MKNIYIFLLFISSLLGFGQSQCNNEGFEGNDVSGYTFRTQVYTITSWTQYNNFPNSVSTPLYALTTNTIDQITGLPKVSSGDSAVRLNDNIPDNSVTSIRKSFTVSQNTISFKYAVVLDNAYSINHPGANAYFQYRLLDSNNNLINGTNRIIDYQDVSLITSSGNPNPTKYSPWTCAVINT